jgi:F-box/TPR repeat protein Pof3
MPKLPPTLKHLILENNPHLRSIPGDNDPIVLPLLETLNIFGTFINSHFLKAITFETIKNGNLKCLSVGGRLNDFNGLPAADEYPPSETVEKLSLATLILGDKEAMGIVDLYPNLQSLDVTWTKITGVAVKHFVNKGVTSLKLDECHNLSTDAVEWARGKGVEVEFNFPSRSSRARTFRESYARFV